MKLSFARIVTFSLVLVLSACAMGPDYERPQVLVPDAFLEPTIPGASVANLKWWELFQDEELTRLIEKALINNKEVAIAMARIEETRAALGFVRADQFPNLDGTAGASRGNDASAAAAVGDRGELIGGEVGIGTGGAHRHQRTNSEMCSGDHGSLE